MDECSWQGSRDDDFERKLLMHCEAHAHEHHSIVDTAFDDDEGEDGSSTSFSMIQIGAEEHNDPPSDVNIVSNNDTTSDAINIVSVIQQEETGIEVVMQRLCASCAMDVTDVVDFDECPFCMAAKKFDSNFEDDTSGSSLGLCLGRSHSIEIGENHDRNHLNVSLLTPSTPDLLTPSTPVDRRRVKGKQKGKLLKGMIVSFLEEENKNAQGEQPTKTPTPESRDDTSPFTKPKTSAMHDDISSSLRELDVKKETTDEFMLRSVSQRVHEVDKLIHESNMLVELSTKNESQAYTATQYYGINNVDAIAVRSQLILLENYYSKQERQERRRRRHLKVYA